MSERFSEQDILKERIMERVKQEKIWVGYTRWIKVSQVEKILKEVLI